MWGIDVVASPIERAFWLNLMALSPPNAIKLSTFGAAILAANMRIYSNPYITVFQTIFPTKAS